MDEAIGDLVLAPFRDIAAQGRIASGKADEAGHDGMRTAAQRLMKEGERALRRIEPLCRKKYDDFGATFVAALKDDEEISRLVEHLNDLLYDFEEYADADTFEADKFVELQACSRKAGPGISHRITRLKLPPQPDEEQGPTSTTARPFGPKVLVRQPSDATSLEHGQSLLPYPEDVKGEGQVKDYMPWPPGQEIEARQVESTVSYLLPTVREEDPLPSPPPHRLLDPWSQRSRDIEQGLELIAQRRDDTAYSDSAIGSEGNSEHAYSPSHTGQAKLPQPAVPPKSPNRIAPLLLEETVSCVKSLHGRDSISPISPQLNRGSAAGSANTSIRSSVSERRSRERDSYFDAISPVSPTRQASGYSLDAQSQGQYVGQPRSRTQSPHVRPLFSQTPLSASTALGTEGLESVMLPAPSLVPDGLMLAEEEEDAAQPALPDADLETQLGGCTIALNSSYYQLRGFCTGAVEVIQGGLGIKRVKKQGLAVGNIEVAKCKACAYELEWKAVERDLNNEATENLTSTGISFRLRFLSKSHMPSKTIGEQIYGCLLCVQQRQTTHPNDATVFFGQRPLFAHLARHPRPLPRVPGLTVIQSEEVVPRQFANNYDLHFAKAPLVSGLSQLSGRDLGALPTATAVQTCRASPTSGARRPADGSYTLTFAAGARILGVQFPEKYQGEWCVGWADHEHGLLAAETIRLDPPRSSDARDQGSSSMQAVARWRFAQKDSKETRGGAWLAFGKGEVLTHIGWSHQDHWCWSGTNAKGRSGLFPRSHIEPGTLMEVAGQSDRESVASAERRMGLLSRISIRHRSGSGGGLSPRASIH